MNDLYNRIEALCLQNNVSITKMCKDSGASRGSLTDLKSERINCLNSVTLAKIAAYFGVTVDYLLGNEAETEQKKIASPKGSEFLEKYSHLTPQNQALIDQMLDQLSKAQSVE